MLFTVPFYDNLGYSYTAQFKIERVPESADVTPANSPDTGQYQMTISDIVDSNGDSILLNDDGTKMTPEEKVKYLADQKILGVDGDGGSTGTVYLTFDTFDADPTKKTTGKLMKVSTAASTARAGKTDASGKTSAETTAENGEQMTGFSLNLATLSSKLKGIAGMSGLTDTNNAAALNTAIAVDMSQIQNIDNKGSSTATGKRGKLDSDAGAGCAVGEMSSISIGMDGKITAAYTNGQTKLLGQIATATFANASGLEKTGDNLYSTTLNSGEAVINDITANGGSMSTGELEMSNVDLSDEFTTMITTQRGFQANSRIITVSDSMLEELVNLKR